MVSLMARREGVSLLVVFLAAAVFVSCDATICVLCTCSGTGGATKSVSCTHMSMDMYRVPGDVPSTTELLDLSGHSIKSIERNDFSNLPSLVNLSLAGNEINSVGLYTFSDLLNLRTLDIHGNHITSVARGAFSGLAKLEKLDLRGNDITRVSRETFAGLPALTTLNLANNPLYCDCGVGWMVSASSFPPLHSSSSSPPTCARPSQLAGRRVDSLSLDEIGCVVPQVTAVATTIAVFKGERVVLSCSVTGASESDIVWYYNGQMVTDGDQLLGNGSLLISQMTAEGAGQYTCVSSNMAGSGNATISVTYLGTVRPRVSIPPSHVHAFTGENVVLRCVGDQRTVSYHWYKDGQPLETSDRVAVVTGVGLNISHVTMDDSGVYSCVVMGIEGSSEASAQLSVTGALISCEGVIDATAVGNIRSMVMFAFNHSSINNVSSPHQLLRRLKLPDDASIELLLAADVFQQALDAARSSHQGESEGGVPALSDCEITLLAELSGCLEHSPTPHCSDVCHHSRYRSVDGSCNNWAQPAWGTADTPFHRLLAPVYEDGLGLPVGWSGGMPSARTISQRVIRSHNVEPDTDVTHMLMQFGQFLDHDLDLAPGTPADSSFTSGAMCDTECSNSAPCFPIVIETGDPRISAQCMPFTRSGGVCGSGGSSLLVGSAAFYREQLNGITSFIDGSQIYGSSEEHAERLRDPARQGWLLEGVATSSGKPFLPFDTFSLIECSTGIHSGRSQCFLAGDVRANEQVGLTAMHTLFFREHNRVASYLSHLNPHWNQETIFQESRRVVIAEWQNIAYSEYLPTILGPSGLGDYHGYDPNVNPTIANAFATAAYRFGHGQILPFFNRLNTSYQPEPYGPLQLRHAFFAPHRLLEEGGIDPLLRGFLATPGKKRAPHSGLNSNLTEALFEQAHNISLDLAALNIQRGRDHGLPSYVQWRQFCSKSFCPDPQDIVPLATSLCGLTFIESLSVVV
ncbi:Peroxidasin, partial [Geodia barretti]